MYDVDAYSDLPQGNAIPPMTIASTGDGLGGNGQMLGDDLATVGGGLNAGSTLGGVCKKCAWFWIIVIGALAFFAFKRNSWFAVG